MNLKTLRKKALADELEVEHILEAARGRLPGLADELRALTKECSWGDGGVSGTNLIIPFRKWAVAAAIYTERGIDGLVELADDKAYVPFVLALLDELHSSEAVLAVLRLVNKWGTEKEVSVRLAASINSSLSFSPAVEVGPEEERTLRDFTHLLLHQELSIADRATVLCALRGVGDDTSIRLISAAPPLPEPWSGIERQVTSRIRKRLKHGAPN